MLPKQLLLVHLQIVILFVYLIRLYPLSRSRGFECSRSDWLTFEYAPSARLQVSARALLSSWTNQRGLCSAAPFIKPLRQQLFTFIVVNTEDRQT